MASTNDHIIEHVFTSILEQLGDNAPEAAFYNSLKSANLPIDNRMLANFIIQDFPWPVGVELRRLFSGDIRDRDKNRIDQVLKVAEKVAQFFSYCLMIQLWDQMKKQPLELSKDFEAQIEQIGRPSFGTYVGIIRAIHNMFDKQNIDSFIEYRGENGKFSKVIDQFNQLVNFRNEERHHISEMDCQEGEELLKSVLGNLAVLAKYKLVTIREIKVVGPKLKPVVFQHSIRMLNSQHEDFTSVDQSFDAFSESHAVLLMKDFNSPEEYLNLSPLVVDTSTLLENQKIAGIKNGIYMYQQVKDGKFAYILTNAPEQAIFNDLPHFDYLKAQFDDFANTLMGGAFGSSAAQN
ncbi:MAG: hypothetical protein OEQ53_04445 [Saprospiraceae bacterium]|nr:hypothetical protein [Saprospiraceae bacterium]